MKTLTVFLVMAIALVAQSGQFQMELKKEIERMHYEYDLKRSETIRGKAERFLKMNPDSWYAHYYMAFIYDHLGTLNMVEDEDKADDYFDLALDYLDTALGMKDFEDGYSLRSSVYGKKIGISPMKGMFLGPRSNNAVDDAYDVSRDNPRVWIIEAIGKMYTPSMFGGDKERSRKLLVKSEKALKNYVESDSLMITWGKADVYAWLSELSVLEEKFEDARRFADQALDLEPNYGHVLLGIYPRIEAGLKKKAE